MNLAVILPAYNEELTIEKTILAFFRELPEAKFVIVDNRSTDRTFELANNVLKENRIRGVVLQESRKGKANAIRKAFSEIDADLYIMSDADLTYPAEEIHVLLEEWRRTGADMLVGDRLSNGRYGKENKRPFHSAGNRLVLGLINFLFGSKLKDPMSGYRIFSRKFVKNYPVLASGFELEIEMTLHALDKRFAIAEFPITYRDRPEGSYSKLNTLSDGYRVLKHILWIFKDYKPMHFFGFFSAAFAFLALLAGVPAISDYIRFRYVYHVPLAVLATGLMLLSWINISIGLILHTVSKIQRTNFELSLLRFENRKEREPVERIFPNPLTFR